MAAVIPATVEDVASLVDVINDAYAFESDPADARCFKNAQRIVSPEEQVAAPVREGRVLKAVDVDGAVVGCVMWELVPPAAAAAGGRTPTVLRYGPLAVRAAAQKRGIGRRLTDAIVSAALRLNVDEVEVEVVDHLHDLRRWYEGQGFRIVGTAPFPVPQYATRPVRFDVLRRRLDWSPIVRPGIDTDVPRLMAIVNAAYEVESDPASPVAFKKPGLDRLTSDEPLRQAVREGRALVVVAAELPTEPLGVMVYEVAGEAVHFGPFAVSPALQGRRLGSALLDAVEAVAQRAACRRIDIDVVSTRTDVLPVYLKRGYDRVGERPWVHTDMITRPVHYILLSKPVVEPHGGGGGVGGAPTAAALTAIALHPVSDIPTTTELPGALPAGYHAIPLSDDPGNAAVTGRSSHPPATAYSAPATSPDGITLMNPPVGDESQGKAVAPVPVSVTGPTAASSSFRIAGRTVPSSRTASKSALLGSGGPQSPHRPADSGRDKRDDVDVSYPMLMGTAVIVGGGHGAHGMGGGLGVGLTASPAGAAGGEALPVADPSSTGAMLSTVGHRDEFDDRVTAAPDGMQTGGGDMAAAGSGGGGATAAGAGTVMGSEGGGGKVTNTADVDPTADGCCACLDALFGV